MKNFIYTLVDYIKELEIVSPVRVGIFDDGESLVVIPVEGSEVIHEYMDGTLDIRLPFEIHIKSKNQENAFNVLSEVMNHMRNIGEFLDEKDQNHALLGVAIDQIPFFETSTEDGYFYYKSKVTIDLMMN